MIVLRKFEIKIIDIFSQCVLFFGCDFSAQLRFGVLFQ